MTQMDLQREYDNRAKVADFAAIVEGWARDAAAFRAVHAQAELGLAYGDSERQKLDIFWPNASRDAPLALFFHGGYWQAMDRSFFSHLAAGLLAHRVAVAVPSYDLCPHVSLATIVEQARGAVAFLYRRHERRMLVMGHSAGGHLAACLLATGWAARGLPDGIVQAALPISGLFDLAPLRQVKEGAALRLDAAEAARLSPLLWPAPDGRLHAVVGSGEGPEYLRQSRSIAEAWGGTWEAAEGAHHFSVIAPLADPGSALTGRALALFQPG